MMKTTFLALFAVATMSLAGCAAEVSDCEVTDPNAASEDAPPCGDQDTPQADTAALSDESQEYCSDNGCQ